MRKEDIERNRRISRIYGESRKRAKKETCLWCGKPTTTFCNSHSVPKCVLRNIAVNGDVDYFNSLVRIPFLDEKQGLNSAGTFRLICNKCDNEIFQEYEDEKALSEKPTERMLEEIAIKNLLLRLQKRYKEIEVNNVVSKEYDIPEYFNMRGLQNAKAQDVKDYEWDLKRIKEMKDSDINAKGSLRLVYWKKLNYVVPIAFQGVATIYGDLLGSVAVDIYDKSKDIVVKSIHICVFPLKESSVVFWFYHSDDHEYDALAEQFNNLDETEKLSILNYILFTYCEDMLMAKKYPHRTWMMQRLEEQFVSNIDPVPDCFKNEMQVIQRNRLFCRNKSFPCILEKKYAQEISMGSK